MVVPTPHCWSLWQPPILSASKAVSTTLEATEARAGAARSCGINPSWGGSSRVKYRLWSGESEEPALGVTAATS